MLSIRKSRTRFGPWRIAKRPLRRYPNIQRNLDGREEKRKGNNGKSKNHEGHTKEIRQSRYSILEMEGELGCP